MVQPYQNYAVPQMNPYQNNFNQPMPMQNPYMDRMNQLQSYQQSLQMQPTQMSGANQPQGLVGKVVNDFAEITANDVPMNGISAVFPKADMSEVQLRAWTPNGTIQTITYKPVLEQNNEQGTNIPQNDFTALNEDVKALREDIKDMRSMIEKSMSGSVAKPTASKVKKAEGENE